MNIKKEKQIPNRNVSKMETIAPYTLSSSFNIYNNENKMEYLYAVTNNEIKEGIEKFTRLFRSLEEALEYRKDIFDNKANIFEISFNFKDPETISEYFIDIYDFDRERIYSNIFIDQRRIKLEIEKEEDNFEFKFNLLMKYLKRIDKETFKLIEDQVNEIIRIFER